MRAEALPLVFAEEEAVLIPWQRHCAELSVHLREEFAGWFGAFTYNPRDTAKTGLGTPFLGPYVSREAAIRNVVAWGCEYLHLRRNDPREMARLYRAAGVPLRKGGCA